MAVFKTTRHNRVSFTLNPYLARNSVNKGWVIMARCDDTSLYDGNYVRAVGFANDCPPNGEIAFRLKRDARSAMIEAIDLGILKVTDNATFRDLAIGEHFLFDNQVSTFHNECTKVSARSYTWGDMHHGIPFRSSVGTVNVKVKRVTK